MAVMVRVLYLIGGLLALALATIGVIVPLLPTTPLVILAAALFARSSPRLHQWLLDNRVFGPLIVEWNEHRQIPLRAKILATVMIVAFGGFAIIFVATWWWLRISLTVLFASVLTWLWTRQTSPSPTTPTI